MEVFLLDVSEKNRRDKRHKLQIKPCLQRILLKKTEPLLVKYNQALFELPEIHPQVLYNALETASCLPLSVSCFFFFHCTFPHKNSSLPFKNHFQTSEKTRGTLEVKTVFGKEWLPMSTAPPYHTPAGLFSNCCSSQEKRSHCEILHTSRQT